MATNPETPRRRHEAEAAALALLLGRRYDLRATIAARGIRPRPFRRIEPTGILRGDLAGPYFSIVNAWRAERDVLLAAYAAALPERGEALGPGALASVQRQIDASEARVAAATSVFIRHFPQIAQSIERWHAREWNGRIKASTGLDVAHMTSPQDGQAEIANAVVRNHQLAESVQQDTASKIGTLLLNSLTAGAPLALVITGFNDTTDRARKRGVNIAVDQADTLSSLLTFARMRSAWLDEWIWRHLDPQKHPRPEHQARDRRHYSSRNAPNDLPGTLPFCQCWAEPVLGPS